jgi:hypothetical protein
VKGGWPPLLVGIAGVVLAALSPLAGGFQLVAIIIAAVLVLTALLVALRLLPWLSFEIQDVPRSDPIRAGQPLSIEGRTGRWKPEASLWFVIETYDEGAREWIRAGEARVNKGKFAFEFTPSRDQAGRRLTLTAVRTAGASDRQIRSVAPDGQGIRRLSPPGGCKELGEISFTVAEPNSESRTDTSSAT